MKKAFTLVELLVVVLIIGILAAVAVPQYQKAVDRAEVARALPILKRVKQMQELYLISNGHYAESFYDLESDQLGDCRVILATVMLCGPHEGRVVLNVAGSTVAYPLKGSGAQLQQFLEYAGNRSNWMRCGGVTTERVERLCKSLGADESTRSTNANGQVFWKVPL